MKFMTKTYAQTDFDSLETSEMAAQALRKKKCLRDIYIEIYHLMMSLRTRFLQTGGNVLEIGSGGGFLKELYPTAITSDVRRISSIDLILSAEHLPFAASSLDAILAIHVIHHIPDITLFLREATRVLKAGGGIICVEPYWSPFARLVYTYMHPEPFDMKAKQWQLGTDSPMTSSNQAMTYLLMNRDKQQFDAMFPELSLVYLKRFGFIRYIMTGGIWLAPRLPSFMFPVLKCAEYLLQPIMPLVALHHMFVWKKGQVCH